MIHHNIYNWKRLTGEALVDQVSCGIDIPTDGELRRENYIHYHCRHLHGFDFTILTEKGDRNGATVALLPTITGKIVASGEHFLDADFKAVQSHTENPVKISVPGPLTIIDTTADSYYNDEHKLISTWRTPLTSKSGRWRMRVVNTLRSTNPYSHEK